MFRAKTVFIIGAGASNEVGLPMGTELLKQIGNLVNFAFDYVHQKSGDAGILDALRILLDEGRNVDKLNLHLKAGQRLRSAAAQALSIDNLLDSQEDDQVTLLGKLGIVRAFADHVGS